jgi:transcriptional regulator with XRE-family HTH domain
MTKIPNNLRECRLHSHLRQIDVATHLGLKSTNRVSRWEQGIAYPHLVNLFKIANLFGVLPHELYPTLQGYQEKGPD